MKKAVLFLADGHEEVEAMTPLDLLRRAGVQVTTASVEGRKTVTGAHQIRIEADALIEEVDLDAADALILPGGMPGTKHEQNCEILRKAVVKAFREGRIVAAICAAPSIFGDLGIVKGKKVTSYPGFEEVLSDATYLTDRVVSDGNMITSRGMGTAFDFGLTLVEKLTDRETVEKLADGTMYTA